MQTDFKNSFVLVQCMTYNQAQFIKDAMDGFVLQETNFPYVCLIMDDASTDNEQAILKDYLNANFEMNYATISEDDVSVDIVARHIRNRNCTFVLSLLKKNLYRTKQKQDIIKSWQDKYKYIALCEGDDYWTDPLKLQKQVDFLEANPEYTLCFHNAIEHWENKQYEGRMFSNIEDKDYTGKDVFKAWVIPTASALLRTSVLTSKQYTELVRKNHTPIGDNLIWISASILGKLRGMSFCGSVYRRHDNSVTFDSGYYKHIHYQYEYWEFCPEPFKSIAADRFFEGAPQIFVICRKDRKERAKLLSESFKISPLRTVIVFSNYFIRVAISKLFRK